MVLGQSTATAVNPFAWPTYDERDLLMPHEWGERHIVIPPNWADPGPLQWLPWQAHMLKAAVQPDVRQATLMLASRLCKSLVLANLMFYVACEKPTSCAMAWPTATLKTRFIDDTVDPMARASTYIESKIVRNQQRNIPPSGLAYKGGKVHFLTSRAVAALQQLDLEWVLADEVDRYGPVSDSASPLELLKSRTGNFPHTSLVVIASTPQSRETSLVAREYDWSTKHDLMVVCPRCGQETMFGLDAVRDTGVYCLSCGTAWDDETRIPAIKQAYWVRSDRQAEDANPAWLGFQASRLYSPYSTIEQVLGKKKRDERNFYTEVMGVPFSLMKDNGITDEQLSDAWSAPIEGAERRATVIGSDTQNDRLELSVVDIYGPYGEDELVVREHVVIQKGKSWPQAYREYRKAIKAYNPDVVFHDIGAAKEETRNYHKGQLAAMLPTEFMSGLVVAIKGIGKQHSDKWADLEYFPGRQSRAKPGPYDRTVAIYTDIVKLDVFSGLRSGRIKLSARGWNEGRFPEDYPAQLQSEKIQRVVERNGLEKLRWTKTRARNEALDCLVYATAAADYLGESVVDWEYSDEAKSYIDKWLGR